MAAINTDFLRFSANSMKELITRKLSEDSKFTDQVYEGSNLAVLIDIISYMYQCLAYLLNNAASESMFADTLLYDNIVRLVKFIGYQPRGCSASSIISYIDIISNASQYRGKVLLPYSRIDTGLTDANGNKIYFSTAKTGSINNGGVVLSDTNNKSIQLYNGYWKMHSTIFTASGLDNETFILLGVESDSSKARYVAQDFIDIYVSSIENGILHFTNETWKMDKNGIFTGYESNSNGLFNNDTIFKSLYPGDNPVYSVYLNLDKTYELKFGNGIVGKKLKPGDKIYVFYLETNGPDGFVEVSDIDTANLVFEHNPHMFGMSNDLYLSIFLINDDPTNYVTGANPNLKWYAITFSLNTSTRPTTEQTVDLIREDAPLWFTTGNRLVTKFDYEYYLKNSRNSSSFGCDIIDVKCMNNWNYLATFYKWLYNLGLNGKLVQYKDYIGRPDIVASPQRYLKKNIMSRYDYYYADSADANNIYLWIKSSLDFDVATITSNMNNILNPIKLITAEIVVCKAINTYFDICAAPEDYALKNYISLYDDGVFDVDNESYIEVTLDDNALAVPSSLQKDICDIILSSFDVNRCSLGQTVRYDDILNKIYEINGVVRVRTVFISSDPSVKNRVFDGLSFASWSSNVGILDAGDDLNISNTIRLLEDFLFPVFYGLNSLINKIKIIKKSLSTVNTIKF